MSNFACVLHTVEVPFFSPHTEKCTDPEDVFSVNTFDELQLDARMVKNLADLAITQLTTIQARALPVILGGKDALVKSQTGSGKTLTYAVPIMQVIVVLFLYYQCCGSAGAFLTPGSGMSKKIRIQDPDPG
jgi:superfamily II DNA/RNA helicase